MKHKYTISVTQKQKLAIRFANLLIGLVTLISVQGGYCAEEGSVAQSGSYSFIADDEVNGGGYFPTGQESRILASNSGRSADYTRSMGDRRAWTYSGLWAVRPEVDNFYQRNSGFYDPAERVLGPFIPDENLLVAGDSGRVFSLTGNYGLSFLTRDVSPERSMIKAGPLTVDFLGVNASALYTSFSGDFSIADPDSSGSSGWIGMVGLPIRASLRLTDTIYFQLSGMVYWLPLENKFGIGSGLGSNWNLGLNSQFNYEFEWKQTKFRLYDYLTSAGNFMDIIEPWRVDEIDAVGRYRFGSAHIDQGTAGRGSYWNPQFGGINNTIGFEAQREAFNDWWAYGLLSHQDFWGQSSFNLDDHAHLESLNLELRYVGDDYWFAPVIGYQLNSSDYFDTLTHQINARFSGRFTEYASIWGSVGYLTQTGNEAIDMDTFLWELGISHNLTEYTQHSLSGGRAHTYSASLDEIVADYLRYTISHAFGPRLKASLHGQYSNGQTFGKSSVESETYQAGVHLNYALDPETNLVIGSTYSLSHFPSNAADLETWLHFASLQRPIVGRLNSSATYQYLEQSAGPGGNFSEHMLLLSLNLAF
ncbi:MAG: hypothetical protein ABL974_05685 [Prosthecobacter sp.]